MRLISEEKEPRVSYILYRNFQVSVSHDNFTIWICDLFHANPAKSILIEMRITYCMIFSWWWIWSKMFFLLHNFSCIIYQDLSTEFEESMVRQKTIAWSNWFSDFIWSLIGFTFLVCLSSLQRLRSLMYNFHWKILRPSKSLEREVEVLFNLFATNGLEHYLPWRSVYQQQKNSQLPIDF